MKCPFCAYDEDKVIDSRSIDDGETIRRRRECIKCQKRFTTYETVEKAPIMVIKKDNSRQAFDRDKILRGLYKACEKRPISAEQMDNIVKMVEEKIRSTLNNEVESQMIGELVVEELKKVDDVAFVRFASVYRHFKDINTFMAELSNILEENS